MRRTVIWVSAVTTALTLLAVAAGFWVAHSSSAPAAEGPAR
jgi:hypothetical protein